MTPSAGEVRTFPHVRERRPVVESQTQRGGAQIFINDDSHDLRLPLGGRLALSGAVSVAIIFGVISAVIDQNFAIDTIIELCTLVLIGVFAWSPPYAVVALVVFGLASAAVGEAGPYSFAMAVAVGLAIVTCTWPLALIYCVATAGWCIAAWAMGQDLTGLGLWGTLAIAVVSGIAGWGYRVIRSRERVMRARMERFAREKELALRDERDRIADELHNVIAHDITIVVMHARALTLTNDPATRSASLQAISDSASQALLDIRRMLRMHTASGELEAAPEPALPPLQSLEQVAADLRALGIDVELKLPDREPNVSNIIASAINHISREAVTNIMRHAPRTTAARVEMTESDDVVTVSVWNRAAERAGRESQFPEGGYGLRRMQDRVEFLGGTLTSGPRDGGWVLETMLPVS